ncbi:MAG: hypothetical protein QM679_13150 [Patulibacter sp.]
MSKPSLPSPDEILAREARARRIAAYAALASAMLVVIAMLLEYKLAHADVPDFDASDLVQTLAAVHSGEPFPRSFLTAVGEFRLQHNTINLAIWALRGCSVLLLLPMAQLLIGAVRHRGGQLAGWVAPANLIGVIVVALAAFVIFGVLEPGIYRTARDAGFLPSDVWDAVRASPINTAQIVQFAGSVLAGITLALASMQAIRVGLLSKVLGYIGVLVGLMFVFPLDQSNIVRAFWFGALAFTVSGRLPNTPPGWVSGTAVAPEPRQPKS